MTTDLSAISHLEEMAAHHRQLADGYDDLAVQLRRQQECLVSPAPAVCYLTVDEVAQRLHLHPKTVWRHCVNGSLPAVRLSPRGRWLVSAERLGEWEQESRTQQRRRTK